MRRRAACVLEACERTRLGSDEEGESGEAERVRAIEPAHPLSP